MATTSIIIRESRNVEYAVRFLQTLNYGEKSPWQVVVKPYRRRRSLEQNALIHKWFQIMGDHAGCSVDKIKQLMKEEFLTPEFAQVMGRTVTIWPETAKMNKAEMSDFMTKIEAFATNHGCVLPHPEDLGR